MKRRVIAIILTLCLCAGLSATARASELMASPTASTVYVNGEAVAFEAYYIGGNNYFKLRDLAYALNGTEKEFEVGYDEETKAIALTSEKQYTAVGGELVQGAGGAKMASPTASRIYLDGLELNLTVYIIGGNNFFKLRDLMEVLDVYVGYDETTKAITLDTSMGYLPEQPPQPIGQTISGLICASDPERGVGGVTVKLIARYSYVIIDTAITDSDGIYKFENVLDGQYYIDVSRDGSGSGGTIAMQITVPREDPMVSPITIYPSETPAIPLYRVSVSIKRSTGLSSMGMNVTITHTSLEDTSYRLIYDYPNEAYTGSVQAGSYDVRISRTGSSIYYSGVLTVTPGGSNRFSFNIN